MSLHLSRPFAPIRPSPPSIHRARRIHVSCSAHYPNSKFRRPYTSVMIVPTGVGAAVGGFAGDALPVARTLASVVDCLISHPNVLNAAMLYWPMPNTLYVEGYALDRFAEGSWALQPIHQNKVGLVLDAGMEEELRVRHLQVADATRASLGLPIVEYIVTDTPLEVEIWIDPKYGKSTGRIKHPGSLLRAVHTLINQSKVDAVAVVGRFPDDDIEEIEDYRQGKGVDLLAGVEAVISHLVVKEFQIPCAHAPALSSLPLSSSLSPRSAAEEIGYTFLPCVLAGLSRAPQYVVRKYRDSEAGCILASDIDSVILPIDACGGDGSLAFARGVKNKPLIIAVRENETVLDDTPEKLGIEAAVKVSNYWEAIGVVAAHKAGVDPQSLRREGIDNIRGRIMSSPISRLLRCGKSCRLRWINYLRHDVKRGNFSEDEEDLIIKLHALLGNRWSLIAGRLPGRTDNEIKNYWNSHLRRKLASMGIDPNNHRVNQSTMQWCNSRNNYKPKELKQPGNTSDDDCMSDAASCMQDETCRVVPDLNLDPTISSPSDRVAAEEQEDMNSPTHVLFR